MSIGNLKIEDYVPVVQNNQGLYSEYPIAVPGSSTIGGSSVVALGTITSASANALTVGLNGTTGPAFNVDSSTALQADGLNVQGLAAGNGVKLSAITTGTNAPLTLDAAGSGTLTIAATSTGNITLGSTSNLVNFAQTKVADGTTAIVTLGQYGGTGRPTAAGQSGWLKIKVAGTDSWLPVWI